MAKTPTTTIDPNAIYLVNLTRSIRVGRNVIHPGANVKLRGDVLENSIEADASIVSSYEPTKTHDL